MLNRLFILFLFIFTINSCSSTTLEDCREEAEGITHSLISEMQKIHSRPELIKRLPKLKKMFDKLVDVIIASHEIKARQPDAHLLAIDDRRLSDALRAEFIRLYSIEGGRDLIEKAQQDALYRLDAFLQKSGDKTFVLQR